MKHTNANTNPVGADGASREAVLMAMSRMTAIVRGYDNPWDYQSLGDALEDLDFLKAFIADVERELGQ